MWDTGIKQHGHMVRLVFITRTQVQHACDGHYMHVCAYTHVHTQNTC